MRRLLPLLVCMTLLLGACNPTVTLLGTHPGLEITPDAATLPPPLARTPYPTPTRAYALNINPDQLKGVGVTVWHGWDGSAAILFEQMAGQFNLSNQWGVKVTVVSQRNLNLLGSSLDKSTPGPGSPDVIVALPEQILAWQNREVDLEPYLHQRDFGFDPNDLPAAFGAQSNLNGVRYGLPAARSARFIFYNLSFAHDLGFSNPPQTPDEFRTQACAANAFWKQDTDPTNDGYGGLALDVAPNWQTPYAWLLAGNGQIFSNGSFSFNTPANLAALDFVTKLRASDCAWLPDTASDEEHLATRRALFITGSLGSIDNQNIAISVAASPDQWTLLPFPGQPALIPVYGPDYAILRSDGPRQLAAWLFIRWMLQAENQAHWALGTGLLPVTNQAIETLKANKTLPPQRLAALNLIPLARTYPQTPYWSLANKILADGFITFLRSYPSIPLADVLSQMDSTIQDLTKK